MNVLRTGSYNIPGGTVVRDSTKISVKTWQQLVTAEKEALENVKSKNTNIQEPNLVSSETVSFYDDQNVVKIDD